MTITPRARKLVSLLNFERISRNRDIVNFRTLSGEDLKRYDPSTDSRYPFELGLGRYYQGDIMLVPPEGRNKDGRVSVPDSLTSYIWPNGTVPYEIAGNFSEC